MTTIQSWLSGLLALQIVLALILFWNNQRQQQDNLQQPLLGVEEQQVDRLLISDNKNSVSLTKVTEQWLIPALKDLPANQTKVKGLLADLIQLKSSWPVATTQSSQQRFEVASDKFQRRIQLYQGEQQVAELYIGTSPGFRKVHLRKADDDAIYTGKLNSYEILTNNEEWLDKALLAAGEINKIKGIDYVLEKTADKWGFSESSAAVQTVIPEQPKPELDTEKAEQLASALKNLKVNTIASETVQQSADDKKSTTVEVTTRSGNWTYRFSQAEDKYYLSRNDRKVLFEIDKSEYEKIAQVKLSQLVKPTSSAGQQPADSTEQAIETNS